ncbi:MAG: flavodoxin family protein [Candidatus Helarchaeota archaeon]
MKILVTYYSETGNTEKVAKSIREALSNEDLTIDKINNIDLASLNNYDLIFLGSPTHANSLPKATKKFLKACPEMDAKFAIFSTHQSTDKAFYSNFFKTVKKILGKKNIVVVDEQFDCLGENRNEQVAKILKTSLADKYEDMVKDSKGRPNDEDLANAREFAKKVLDKLTAKAKL